MMASIPTNAWYGDASIELDIPGNWRLTIAGIRRFPEMNVGDLEAAVLNPIGSEPLQILAQGRKNAVLLIEDITRPVGFAPILTIVLDELNAAGIPDASIKIMVANGTHRPMTRNELLLKIGKTACERVSVLPHNCYDGLTRIGTTKAGTELFINSFVAQSDLIIGLGGVYPHGMAGFSGGAKIILPGIAGIESIAKNHLIQGAGYANVDGNPLRDDMEDAARMARLSFIINCVVNDRREICGVFSGDPITAHRKACRFAREVYRTELKVEPEILVLNAYPMDTELFQAAKAFGAAENVPSAQTVILMAECPEGFGYHALCGPGGRFHQKEKDDVRKALEGRRIIICSRNIEYHDVRKKFPDSTLLFKTWMETLEFLQRELKSRRSEVVLFPTATIQIPET